MREIAITTGSDDCSSVYLGQRMVSESEYTDKIIEISVGGELLEARVVYNGCWSFELDLPKDAKVLVREGS